MVIPVTKDNVKPGDKIMCINVDGIPPHYAWRPTLHGVYTVIRTEGRHVFFDQAYNGYKFERFVKVVPQPNNFKGVMSHANF